MFCRGPQNLLNVRPLRIRGPDGVVPSCQGNAAVKPKIDNYLCFAREAVNMTRRMIVRISNESDTAKPQRNHGGIITQACLGLIIFFRQIRFPFAPPVAAQLAFPNWAAVAIYSRTTIGYLTRPGATPNTGRTQGAHRV